MSAALASIGAPRSEPFSHPTRIELESVDCLLCGGANHETVVVASDPAAGIGGRFRVVRCRDCRLSFTNPRPTEATIGAFYPPDYNPYQGHAWDDGWGARIRRGLERAVLATHFGYAAPARSLRTSFLAGLGLWRIRRRRLRQSWIPFRSPGRLLDFGCGAGGFLQEMRAFGWDVQGLDMSADVARQVTESTGIPVHAGTLPHPAVRPESFDAVTMWNSLEHVHDPCGIVRSAGAALRRGGLLVIGVPNFASWSFRTFREEWHALDLPRHLVHFTPETLCDLLGRQGFRILSLDHIARDGWVRHSARNAARTGRGPKWLKACGWKPVGMAVSDWAERTRQADFIRVIAEK